MPLWLRGAAAAIAVATLASGWLFAANPRNYIEAVRRAARVVYVGEVLKVDVVERSRLALTARATLRVVLTARPSSGRGPVQATATYSSYDEQSPPLDGGPQYRLRPGELVVVFGNSFDDGPQPHLIHGTREDVARRLEELRRAVAQMSPQQLASNEITEADRASQLELYGKLLSVLRPLE